MHSAYGRITLPISGARFLGEDEGLVVSFIGRLAEESRRSRFKKYGAQLGRQAVQEGTCIGVDAIGIERRPIAHVRLSNGLRVKVAIAAEDPVPVPGDLVRVCGGLGGGDEGTRRIRLSP